MASPKLFFGTRRTNAMLQVGRGYLDRGLEYDFDAKTNRYAPGGSAGECIFISLYAVVTFTASMVFSLMPIVDGVELEAQTITLVQNATATRQTRVFELGLSVPVLIGGVERARVSPRGTWFQIRAATGFVVSGDPANQLVVDGLTLEYLVVRESQQPRTAR
jgi:hypothetical protein